jgi:CHAD domain-containing protein
MALVLKRKECLRKGLQRISEKRLRGVLNTISQDSLTAKPVHEVRKAIKSLRATLRLTREALSTQARKARNQALRDLADRFSGPRDAAVMSAAFEKTYRESLTADFRPESRPHWASQLQQGLTRQANAVIPAESYQGAADEVRRLKGQMLPFENFDYRGGSSGPSAKDDWAETIEQGLKKTYRQGRRLLRQIAAVPKPTDEQWHALRKRAKDLGYQLVLLKKVKGIKPLMARLDKLGSVLGDARDLSLLRDYLYKIRDKREFPLVEQPSFHRLMNQIDQQCQSFHRRALSVAKQVYRCRKKNFTDRVEKRWRRWKR